MVDQWPNDLQSYSDLQRDLGAPTDLLAARLDEVEAASVLRRLPPHYSNRAYALTQRGLAFRNTI